MCTSQNYDGKRDSIPSNEQTVNVDLSALTWQQRLAHWRAGYLRDVAADDQAAPNLFDIVEVTREIAESYGPTQGLCLLLEHFVSDHPEKVAEFGPEIRSVIAHMARLDRLQTAYDLLNASTNYADQHETTVNNWENEGAEVGGE